jgi:hypothetical protein
VTTTSPASEGRFPSVGAAALAGLLATSIVLAAGTLIGIGADALVTNVWRNHNAGLGWLALVVNLISHAAAILLAVVLMKRLSGGRAELLRLTILLTVGYAVIAFFVTFFRQIGTRALVAASNAMPSSLSVLSFILWFGVPSAIAFFILAVAGRVDHPRRS